MNVLDAMRQSQILAPSAARVSRPRDARDRWDALREFYRLALPAIMASPPHIWAVDPYEVDWLHVFTPIEYGLWSDIRDQGVVLYPQFPVGRYFADFGHPVARVAVECDGAAYHKDLAKDWRREREIEELGWAVYRISGRECVAPQETLDEEDNVVPRDTVSSELIRHLALTHGISGRHRRSA